MHTVSLRSSLLLTTLLVVPLAAQSLPKVPKLPPLQPTQPQPTQPQPEPQPGQPTAPPPTQPQNDQRGETPTAPATQQGGVGIAFQPNERGELVIAQLAPEGPAARAKVPVGGVLRAVDGRPIAGQSMEQVRAVIVGPVGSNVTLTIETEREVLDVLLVRAPLGAPTPNANGNGGGGPTNGGGNAPGPQALGDFPAWMQPGVRATYFTGTATLAGVSTQLVPNPNGIGWVDDKGRRYSEEDVPSTGGAGFTQYEFAAVAPDCIAANQVTFVFADAGLRTVSRTGTVGMVGDRNGLSDIWLPPARLRAMLADGSARRFAYPLNGRTYDAVVSEAKSDSGYLRYTYDLETGLLLVYSSSTTGAPVLTPNGNTATTGAGATTITTVQLRSIRQPQLPWLGQRAPQWLQNGQQLTYSGSYKNSLAEGLLAPWRYDSQITLQRRSGDAFTATIATRLDYGTGGQPQDGQVQCTYGPGAVAPLWLDPSKVQNLQRGQVLDQDPITGWQVAFAGSDGRVATIVEQGPLEQQSYSYDLQSGVMVATTVRMQQGPATLTIDLRLQQR